MYPEDDFLPLSALTHFVYCPRRAALTRLEGVWAENVATAEGGVGHTRAHDALCSESRPGQRVARGLMVRSQRLGLWGQLDVVEFLALEEHDARGAALPGLPGRWRPFPVEYKRGRLREEKSFAIQLCAQAICLEEMLGVEVAEGALYYGKTRRRLRVVFTPRLRSAAEDAALRLHALIAAGQTPAAVYSKKCDACSLAALCLPRAPRSVSHYLQHALQTALGNEENS